MTSMSCWKYNATCRWIDEQHLLPAFASLHSAESSYSNHLPFLHITHTIMTSIDPINFNSANVSMTLQATIMPRLRSGLYIALMLPALLIVLIGTLGKQDDQVLVAVAA